MYVQADQRFRSNPQALKQLYARSRNGEMVPLEQVVRLKETTAPQVISHFNLFRSASLNGSAAPGVSSGEALKEMERIADAEPAAGHGLRVVGHLARGNQGGPAVALIFGLALLLVYLTLAAQYESLVLPFIVLLGRGENATATREFLYVDDAAEGIVLAAERYDGAKPVNLGTGREISIRDLVGLIVEITGFQGDVRWDASQSRTASRDAPWIRVARASCLASKLARHSRMGCGG